MRDEQGKSHLEKCFAEFGLKRHNISLKTKRKKMILVQLKRLMSNSNQPRLLSHDSHFNQLQKKKESFDFFYFRLILEDTHVNQELDLVLLEVAADLGRQEDARAGAEFTVLLVQFSLKHKLLEVDESHGHRRLLVAALILRQLSYLPFQAAGNWRDERERRKVELPSEIISTSLAVFFFFFLPPDLAEREPYMGEFLFEGFVHVLLEVGGFDVFDDRGLKGKTETQAVTTRTRFQRRQR